MRKVIYEMSVSLDGFAETTDRSLDWVIVDEELHTVFNEHSREAGAFLYGRRTYELMADYWPTADEDPSNPAVIIDFARIWKAMPKIVFSKSLSSVGWGSRLLRGDLAEEVPELKAQPGKDLGVAGPTLAASFMRLGLIDEYRLFVNPVVLGAGMPYLPPLEQRLNLRLLESRTFSSGVVYLRYQR